ncbi:MAG: hypothetical protein EXR37_07525 [Limnohabitans sp.]|nr:hypothetical protein [Limnohabitans sp.]
MPEKNKENSLPQALGLTIYDLPDPLSAADADARRTAGGRLRMLFVMLVCAAPVLASYLTYYVIRPQSSRNFGELIQPVKAIPSIQAASLDGKTFDMQSLKGQWLLISVSSGACTSDCQKTLLFQRQICASLGREKDRTDCVWLITDDEPVSAELKSGMTDAVILRIPHSQLASWLEPAPGHALHEHLYLVDPRGDWMMRFPAGLSIEQAGFLKKDWERLLRASVSWDLPGR